jgi:hypothetical protein
MTEPTALIDLAAEHTEDAWVTPEADQMWPEDWYSEYADADPSPYAGDYSDGGEDAYLDSYWESLCEM